jgi:5'-3' exonuclease
LLALIDGDIVCYRCAAANEKAEPGIAKWQADQMLTRIIEETNALDWKIFLSGDNNFRYTIFPDYKANRRDMVKPRHLELLREHLVLEWNATICDGIEADDALGIASQSGESPECVVCSIDKDLRQLPGNHYHFVNRQWLQLSALDGERNFYYQLLVGDSTDNIKGCQGIGPVKAERILRDCGSSEAYFLAAKSAYEVTYASKWFEELDRNAQLLYIQRRENDTWKPPVQEREVKSSSGTELTSTSTELTTMEAENYIQSDGQQTVNSGLTQKGL